MASVLEQLCEEIKAIRVYLIKIGQSRRKGKILSDKNSEANEIFMRFSNYVNQITNEIKKGKISSGDCELIYKYIERFQSLYTEIIELCKSKESNIMASFDLKTALSLLPLMTDEEVVVKQLIDNIEYYNSTLSTPECKKQLINFVLKSRLSQTAKLQLSQSYSTVDDLLCDMKKTLLPQKSAASIQTKLTSMRQNDLSVQDYGKEITELFVQLTISQANGNTDNFNVLKPLNEKYAVKKFADGLRNRRLSTIIAARDFSSLKDAIQAAQDEEIASSTSFGEVLGMYNNNNKRFSRRGQRGRSNQRYSQRGFHRGAPRGYNHQRGGWGQPLERRQQQPTRPRSFRGRSFYNNNARNQRMSYNNVHFAEPEAQPDVPESELETGNNDNKFFRD